MKDILIGAASSVSDALDALNAADKHETGLYQTLEMALVVIDGWIDEEEA